MDDCSPVEEDVRSLELRNLVVYVLAQRVCIDGYVSLLMLFLHKAEMCLDSFAAHCFQNCVYEMTRLGGYC